MEDKGYSKFNTKTVQQFKCIVSPHYPYKQCPAKWRSSDLSHSLTLTRVLQKAHLNITFSGFHHVFVYQGFV